MKHPIEYVTETTEKARKKVTPWHFILAIILLLFAGCLFRPASAAQEKDDACPTAREPWGQVQGTYALLEDGRQVFLACAEGAEVNSGPFDGVSEPLSAAGSETESINVRVSRYWPPLGGPNCAYFADGQCLSSVSGCKPWINDWPGKEEVCGKSWEELNGRVAACPPEWEFGTSFQLLGQEWLCADRGGAIVEVEGVPWVDLMSDRSLVPYGTIMDAEKYQP